jgi:hypothetical protein
MAAMCGQIGQHSRGWAANGQQILTSCLLGFVEGYGSFTLD